MKKTDSQKCPNKVNTNPHMQKVVFTLAAFSWFVQLCHQKAVIGSNFWNWYEIPCSKPPRHFFKIWSIVQCFLGLITWRNKNYNIAEKVNPESLEYLAYLYILVEPCMFWEDFDVDKMTANGNSTLLTVSCLEITFPTFFS